MELQISRILHAGFIFTFGSSKIAFDPIFENPFSVNCFAFPAIQIDTSFIPSLSFDAVFISHYHEDHCSLKSIALLNRETPIYLFCVHEELFQWIKQLGFANVHSLEWNRWVKIGSFAVKTLKAVDEDVDSLFHIQVGDYNILNVVDSWIHPQSLESLIGIKWDLVLWPFQLMQELEVLSPRPYPRSIDQAAETYYPEEWIEQWESLAPQRIIPSSCQFCFESWSWYNNYFFAKSYADFAKSIEAILPACEIIRLDPGETMSLGPTRWQKGASLDWIKKDSLLPVDYAYRPYLPVPTTKSIADHLPKLTDEEFKRIQFFCEETLLESYRQLDPERLVFFAKPRVWQLVVWDANGPGRTYLYKVRGGQIESFDQSLKADWFTEIPGVKLLGALEKGESLTSIYMRINNLCEVGLEARPEQEKDLFEDPLLRVLFEGKFGTYQQHQLAELLAKK